MSKFRVKVKLQGFELEIEGSRQDDAAIIGRNIGDQISSLLMPAVNIVEGEVGTPASPNQHQLPFAAISDGKKRSRRSRSQSSEPNRESTSVVDFRHDPSKYGMPSQQWNTSQKAIWLLYVVKDVTGISELTTGQIYRTFNTHFRQSKTVTNSNVSRDLGKAKLATPALVGEDTTKSPAAWFLTDEGVRRAQALIAESLTPRAA